MLCRILQFPVPGQRPVDTSVFSVDAVISEKEIRVTGMLQQRLVSEEHISIGEEPEDPAVQDASLDCFLIQVKIISQISVIAAVFLVFQIFPEGNDLMFQMVFYFLYEHFSSLTFCFRDPHDQRIPISVSVSDTTLWSLI